MQVAPIRRIAGHDDAAVTFSVQGSRSPLKKTLGALRKPQPARSTKSMFQIPASLKTQPET